MRMTSDDVIAYVGPKGAKGKCRVRVYEPDDLELDATVVIASELPEDPEPGIREAASTIAARVAASFRLYERPVFIDHRLPEDFELVWFGRYRAREIRRMGPHLLWDLEVGEPERKPLDRRTVETLVGQPV
jgi:hypothetical protein